MRVSNFGEFYKVTKPGGRPLHSGDRKFHNWVPNERRHKKRLSPDNPIPCSYQALHFCKPEQLLTWYRPGCWVWEAYPGRDHHIGVDKCVTRSLMLCRPHKVPDSVDWRGTGRRTGFLRLHHMLDLVNLNNALVPVTDEELAIYYDVVGEHRYCQPHTVKGRGTCNWDYYFSKPAVKYKLKEN